MTRALFLSYITAIGALSLQCPTAVAAQDRITLSVKVSVADLDLASPAGKRTFDQRLTRAIGVACGAVGETDLALRNAQAACRASARRDVAPQVVAALNAPQRHSATVLAAARTSPTR